MTRFESGCAIALLVLSTAGTASGQLSEMEPNNDSTTANPLTIGATIRGTMHDTTDIVDWFALDLTAGTIVDFAVSGLSRFSWLQSMLFLYDNAGRLVVWNEGFNDARIFGFTVPASGRYHLGLFSGESAGGLDHEYSLATRVLQSGPGDPTTVRPHGQHTGTSIAAGPHGEAYVLLAGIGMVMRVPALGEPDTFALVEVSWGNDLVVDGLGEVLVIEHEAATITRFSAAGVRSVFASTAPYLPLSLTIDRVGDVWVFALTNSESRLFRYSPLGQELEVIDAGSLYALRMAFSPAGVLHVTDGRSAIHRMEPGNVFVPVFSTTYEPFGLAFDVDGNMYVTTFYNGVLKLGPDYQRIDAPFAISNLEQATGIAFLRDANGEMTSRLVALGLLSGWMVEMNPKGVTAPGLRIGPAGGSISLARAADGLLIGGILEADEKAYLDARGNRNATYDVGDLRALILSQ